MVLCDYSISQPRSYTSGSAHSVDYSEGSGQTSNKPEAFGQTPIYLGEENVSGDAKPVGSAKLENGCLGQVRLAAGL